MDNKDFNKIKEKAEKIWKKQKTISNPYLDCLVVLNSDGFHHLQFSSRRERDKKEQCLKFNLLPLALKVIKKAGTLQEYRRCLVPVGKKSKDGTRRTNEVEYWGFESIENLDIKIRVILRKIGNGQIILWSVMPVGKLGNKQRLYINGIEDD